MSGTTTLEVRDLSEDAVISDGNRAAELALRYEIKDAISCEGAIELIVAVEDAAKRVKKQRDSILDPLKEAMERVKAIASGPMEQLESAGKMLRQKVKNWQAEQERLAREQREAEEHRRREEQERIEREQREARERQAELDRKHAEEVAAAAAANAPPPAPPPPVPVPIAAPPVRVHVPDAPRTFDSSRGQAVTKKRWTYEVIDPNLVPREYCDPAPAKLRAAVSSLGVREIPGVRIFEETDLSVRKR